MESRKYRRFSIEERCEIARRSKAGQSIRQIAADLDRSASSVSRELKRNGGSKGYAPSYAGERAQARRWTGSKLLRLQSHAQKVPRLANPSRGLRSTVALQM